MQIPPSIDLTQFHDQNGNFTLEGKEGLMRYADTYFEELHSMRSAVSAGICMLKARVNEKLQERRTKAAEAIIALEASEEYSETAEYDYELNCFSTAVKIYQMERGGKENTIFDRIEYIEDFREIFDQLTFYFRRMQLRLAKPICMEGLTYIRKRKLSVFAVAQILLDCNLGGKEQIADTLADLYAEQGCKKEALFIVSLMIEQGREEYKPLLEAKRQKIMEML